ncbi:MAG: hypothetical protein JNK59_05055 [Sterolibacteriaceae bacterium]|nr:hypothetical protein [Sterolibacteriaceae bacterium]
MAKKDITEAAAAYGKVQETIQALRADHAGTIEEIKVTEARLKALRLAPVPLEDLKAGILDFVEASGRRYLDGAIRRNLAQFATGGRVDGEGRKGRPLRYCDIEGTISGESPVLSSEQIFQERLGEFNGHVLGGLFVESAKDALRRVMTDMTPEEFGYGKIDPHEIGTDRATRRKAVQETKEKLAALGAQRDELARQLRGLGFSINEGGTE